MIIFWESTSWNVFSYIIHFHLQKMFSFDIFTLLMFRKPNKTTINKNIIINLHWHTSFRFSFIFRYFKVFQVSKVHLWSVWLKIIHCKNYSVTTPPLFTIRILSTVLMCIDIFLFVCLFVCFCVCHNFVVFLEIKIWNRI